MGTEPTSLERLIAEFSKLPGIGRKSAQRLAFYLLKEGRQQAEALSQAILALKDRVGYCSICFNVTEADPCPICANPKRNRTTICVVEEPSNVLVLERTGEYNGLYHVLGGLLSPIEGIGPDELTVKPLLDRLQSEEILEVIIATNPVVEGDATAAYLANLIKPLNIRVSRIALGLPVGGDLDYADEITLSRALLGRTDM